MPMLPVNNSIALPIARHSKNNSPRDNIKLSAQFCDLIPNKTAAAIGHQSDPKATKTRIQTARTITKTIVAILRHQDQIMATDHPCDQLHQTPTINVNRRAIPPHFGEILHPTMPLTLFATIVEELVTMQDNAQLQITDLRTPITGMEEIQGHQPIMRTLLLEIKEPILSLIHLHLMLKQLITIKPSLLHQTTTLSLTMDHQQSGLIPTCLKWKSTHH
ncbi:hypothetical protein MHU86_5953 [Fragilaria crotonensis]|nr:hypothetical protein MHU86_5953 [Fragilaria crotonensis]